MPVRAKLGAFDLFDKALVKYVDTLFASENLLQVILHAHLLAERAMNEWLRKHLSQPGILDDQRYGRWSFQARAGLVMTSGLVHSHLEDHLLGLSQLRNRAAHRLEVDLDEAVRECLPTQASGRGSNSANLVKITVMTILSGLNAVTGYERDDVGA